MLVVSQPIGEAAFAEIDIIVDVLQRVIEKCPEAAKASEQVEKEARRDWGGDRPYIAKLGENGKKQLCERDERIKADHRRGEREALLSRRYGISIRRIRQILAA